MIKLLLITIISVFSLFAQYNITGRITDKEGNGIEGVNIFLIGEGRGGATNGKGEYSINNIPMGEYKLQASGVGFRSVIRNVNLQSNLIIDLILETEAVRQGEVIVTAGKHQQLRIDLPVSAEVLGGDYLIKRNIVNIRDILGNASGVTMVDDQVNIRGSSGYTRGAGTRVLVAIDGIPMYTGDTGEIIWEIIPVTEIERIEIIKGAASSLYGSSAAGGVINIITKGIPEVPMGYIRTGFGIYDKPAHDVWKWTDNLQLYNGVTGTYSGRFGRGGLTVSLTRLQNQGYRKNNDNERYTGYLRGNYSITEKSSMSIFLNGISQETGYFLYWKDAANALIPPDADLGRRINSDRIMGGILYNNNVDEDIVLSLKLSYYRTHWRDQSVSRNDSKAEVVRGETQFNYQYREDMMLTGGFEITTSAVKSNLFGNPSSFSAGVYLQNDFNVTRKLLLSGGIRYENTRVEGLQGASSVAPKAGINYKVNNNIILRGNAGVGFRVPSLAETYTSTSVSGINIKPNTNIKPERNFSTEAGVIFRLNEKVELEGALFHNEFYDYIEPVLVSEGGNNFFTFNNVIRARIQGGEIGSRLELTDQIDIRAGYTYLWSRDLEAGMMLKYRPRHSGVFSAGYNNFPFDAGVDFKYWSRVEEMDFELVQLGVVRDGRKRVDVYVVDLRAGYNLAGAGFPLRVMFNIKNLLNYNYVELIGNIAPIRNYSLSLELFF
jgi:outer membrane receptor for ferrienterochelin and colicins